jgi:hypothetical protein
MVGGTTTNNKINIGEDERKRVRNDLEMRSRKETEKKTTEGGEEGKEIIGIGMQEGVN